MGLQHLWHWDIACVQKSPPFESSLHIVVLLSCWELWHALVLHAEFPQTGEHHEEAGEESTLRGVVAGNLCLQGVNEGLQQATHRLVILQAVAVWQTQGETQSQLRINNSFFHSWQGFMQDQIIASYTCFGAHVDVN